MQQLLSDRTTKYLPTDNQHNYRVTARYYRKPNDKDKNGIKSHHIQTEQNLRSSNQSQLERKSKNGNPALDHDFVFCHAIDIIPIKKANSEHNFENIPIVNSRLRRKSSELVLSTKQQRLDYANPLTNVFQHMQQGHSLKVLRQRTIFHKMSNILLKHTSVLRCLNFWTGKKNRKSPSKLNGQSQMNPILLYDKLKKEVELYKSQLPQENNKELEDLQVEMMKLSKKFKLQVQDREKLSNNIEKVVLDLQIKYDLYNIRNSTRKSIDLQQYINFKEQLYSSKLTSPIKQLKHQTQTKIPFNSFNSCCSLPQLKSSHDYTHMNSHVHKIYLKDKVKIKFNTLI